MDFLSLSALVQRHVMAARDLEPTSDIDTDGDGGESDVPTDEEDGSLTANRSALADPPGAGTIATAAAGRITPRLACLMSDLHLAPVLGVNSMEDLAVMDTDRFGKRSDDARRTAWYRLAHEDRQHAERRDKLAREIRCLPGRGGRPAKSLRALHSTSTPTALVLPASGISTAGFSPAGLSSALVTATAGFSSALVTATAGTSTA